MATYKGTTWTFTNADVSVNPVTNMELRVATIRWVGATSASHKVVLQDAAGSEVWRSDSESADDSDESQPMHGPGQGWPGLIIAQLDSGQVTVDLQ